MTAPATPTAAPFIDLTLDVAPIPKGRPRAGNGRVYTPAATRAYEDRIGWLLRAARVQHAESGDLRVAAVFHLAPGQRGDVDNFAKALLDGANGVAWRDDAQVTELSARIVRGSDRPRVELAVYRIEPADERTRP